MNGLGPPIFLHVEVDLVSSEPFLREVYWYDPSDARGGAGHAINPSSHPAWEPVVCAISASELEFRQRYGVPASTVAHAVTRTLKSRVVLSLNAQRDQHLLERLCRPIDIGSTFHVEALEEGLAAHFGITADRLSSVTVLAQAEAPVQVVALWLPYFTRVWALLHGGA